MHEELKIKYDIVFIGKLKDKRFWIREYDPENQQTIEIYGPYKTIKGVGKRLTDLTEKDHLRKKWEQTEEKS